MKKSIVLVFMSTFGMASWADCSNTPAYDAAACYTQEINLLKKQLNQTYIKLYKQTEAKTELDNAQKSWLVYKDKQCSDFTLANAGASSGQIIYDLSCQADLFKSRLKYLKSITRP